MLISSQKQTSTSFVLVPLDEAGLNVRRFILPRGVCEVGRGGDCEFPIPSSSVSKHHARLILNDGRLTVIDLGSTNGTHVNGIRIEQSMLVENDMVQFANVLFRVEVKHDTEHDGTVEEGLVQWAQTLLSFDVLLSQRRVIPFYQPIIELGPLASSDGIATQQAKVGFEVLARSSIPELANPAAMFGMAERLGQQAALSELMRSEGLRVADRSDSCQSRFYLNTHPHEVINTRLVESLHGLRKEFPSTAITIEIHEAAVTGIAAMKQFRQTLSELDMQLAYDDFGAGQGRLLELAEVPPDVLKFDMQLIRDIDTAPLARQELLRSLIQFAMDLGATALAEGVETEAEHGVCVELGFQLGQGYFYGKPAAIENPQ